MRIPVWWKGHWMGLHQAFMVCMFMSVVTSHKAVTGNCIYREIFIRHFKTVQWIRFINQEKLWKGKSANVIGLYSCTEIDVPCTGLLLLFCVTSCIKWFIIEPLFNPLIWSAFDTLLNTRWHVWGVFFLRVNASGKWRMNFHNIFRKFHFFLFVFCRHLFPAYAFMYSAWWPFLTWLSHRAQSDRRTSYQETGVVHQITYSFSYFLFYLCFIYSFYSWNNKWSAISS